MHQQTSLLATAGPTLIPAAPLQAQDAGPSRPAIRSLDGPRVRMPQNGSPVLYLRTAF